MISANIISISSRRNSPSGTQEPAELILELITEYGGAWWDTSDITTLFQDTAGTTPVTEAGQTVKRISDKSGNGWHLTNTVGDLYQVDDFGKGYVQLSGSTGQGWVTTNSQSAFKFLHDGSGGSLITMVERVPVAITARSLFRTTLTNNGFDLQINGAGVPQMTVRGESGVYVQQTNPLVAPFGPGARRVHLYTLDDAELKQYCDGEQAYRTTPVTGTASKQNSGQSLFIAATMRCQFFAAIAVGKVITQSEWTKINNYLHTQHDRALPNWNTPFVLGGQSNMEGSNGMTENAEPVNVNIAMYDKGDKLRIANEPTHDRTNWIPTNENGGLPVSHSCALKFAKDIHEATSGSVMPILVPGAIGGVGMSLWMPTENRVDRTTLYGSVNARLIRLNQLKSNVPVFVWFGHEADSSTTSENLATGFLNPDYSEAFKNLFDEWRSEYPDSPIIFCQLSANNTATATKRRAQESLRRCEASFGGDYAIPNSYMVVTHDVKRNASPDDVHLSEEAQIEVGRRIALAYRGGVLGEAINWQGPRLVSITKPGADTVKVKFSKTINDNENDYGNLFRVYSDGSEHTVDSAVRDPADDTAVLLTLSANHSGVVVVTYTERNTSNNVVRADVVADEDDLPAPAFGPVVAE